MSEEQVTVVPIPKLLIPPLLLFPNSGHHFVSVPIDELVKQDDELRKRCDSDNFPWCRVREDRPWIRMRYGSRDGKPVVWLAVDSNLGRATRGWVYEPEEELSKERAGNYATTSIDRVPYAFVDETQLPSNHAETIKLMIHEGKHLADALLSIVWLRPIAEPIDVDLIVDFGNTRTVALALEHNLQAGGSLSAICHPIRFLNRGEEYSPFTVDNDPAAIIDSWFILHEPLFSNMEPNQRTPSDEKFMLIDDLKWGEFRKGLFGGTVRRVVGVTKRVPQMFVEMSPVLMGSSAAGVLAQLDLRRGGNYFMSSPKRYLWDTDKVGHLGEAGAPQWTMNINRWHPHFQAVSGGTSSLPKPYLCS